MKQKKRKKFIHSFFSQALKLIYFPLLKIKCRYKFKKFDNRKQNYLVLYNHQTMYDQFMVGLAFKKTGYFVASEDIFSIGFVSKLIKAWVAPIPFLKSKSDVGAVKECIKTAREGNTIFLSPEGNRTFSGKTEYIKPAIGKLVKVLKIPVAFFVIEGGFGVLPRFADKPRKGSVHGSVKRILTYDEYKDMSAEEIDALIKQELYVNESVGGEYPSPIAAEHLERVLFLCPKCGETHFSSKGQKVWCESCGMTLIYGADKQFHSECGVVPYKNVNEWYEAQKDFVRHLDFTKYETKPFSEDKACIKEVIVYKRKQPVMNKMTFSVYSDHFECVSESGEKIVFPFENVTGITCIGRNKLNFYTTDKIFQVKGNKGFNPVKYVLFYYAKYNYIQGDIENEFLGL